MHFSVGEHLLWLSLVIMNDILFGLLYFLSPVAEIGFVPHTPARREIIFDLNCRHLHSLLAAMLFSPLILAR